MAVPPPKKFFNPVSIDLDTYKSGDVDFYTQALDVDNLAGTGVGIVNPDDITKLKDYGIADGDGEGPTQDDALNELGGINIQATPKEIAQGKTSMFPGGTGIEYNNFDSFSKYDSYSDYINAEKPQGAIDRVDFISNILEPITSGRFGDIDFSAGTKGLADRVGKDLTEAVTKTDAKTVAKGYLAAQGPMLALAGSAILSTDTVTNAFGSTSARPSGLLGLVADTVHATQYADMAHNRAVARAVMTDFEAARGVSGDYETDEYGNPMNVNDFTKNRDLGFSMKFGSGPGATGITRKAGTFTYTGNMRGLDNQTLKNIEAVQRGFVPSTFGTRNFGFDYTGRGATTFEEAGYSGSLTGDGDRYTDDGKYMDGFGRVSMMGRARDFTNFTNQWNGLGLTDDEKKAAARSVLDGARAGKGKLGDLKAKSIADIKAAKAQAAKAEADRQQEQAAQAAYDSARAAQSQREIDRAMGNDDGDGGGGSGPSGNEAGYGAGGGFGLSHAKGGKVQGYAMGGTAYPQKEAYTSGFVDRPPSQVSEAGKVADDKPLKAPEGSYVLNAAAIEHMGESDVRKMIMDAQKEAVRRGVSTGDFERHSDLIDIAISSGEAIIAPHLVKIIGEDRLEKINKRGLRKTEERVQRTKQEKPVAVRRGGFLT